MANSGSTIFNYSFAPPAVFVASTTDLTLTIENPVGGSAIQWQGGPDGDEIDITFATGSGAGDLMNQLPNQTRVTPDGFSATLTGSYFAIKSVAGTTLQPGDKIVVAFEKAVINGATGDSRVTIQEYIGSASNSGAVSITKQPQELAVIAWLDPYVVGMFEEANLNWQSAGGIGVKVFGFASGTGDKDFPVCGDPPYPGTTRVTVSSMSEAQRTYTLQVYTGDNRHDQSEVTLTRHAPIINSFEADKSSPIKVDSAVNLSWHSLFGASSILSSNAGMNRNNPISPLQVNPGQELASAYNNNYSNMPDTVTYTLTVNGFEEPATRQVSFVIKPVGLVYFKYTERDQDGKLSGVKAELDPDSWTAQKLSLVSNDLSELTIYQPGGQADLYYLGDNDTEHPQIQYFNAQNKGNNSYEFSWVTANLNSETGMVLVPGNIQIKGDNVKQGSVSIILDSSKEYTLSGVGTNGQGISSKLVVTVPMQQK